MLASSNAPATDADAAPRITPQQVFIETLKNTMLKQELSLGKLASILRVDRNTPSKWLCGRNLPLPEVRKQLKVLFPEMAKAIDALPTMSPGAARMHEAKKEAHEKKKSEPAKLTAPALDRRMLSDAFGRALKIAMEKHGHTYSSLAKAIPCSDQSIRWWCVGANAPNAILRERLLVLLPELTESLALIPVRLSGRKPMLIVSRETLPASPPLVSDSKRYVRLGRLAANTSTAKELTSFLATAQKEGFTLEEVNLALSEE